MKFQTSSHIPEPLNGHFRANRTVYYEKRSFHPGPKHSNRAPGRVWGGLERDNTGLWFPESCVKEKLFST